VDNLDGTYAFDLFTTVEREHRAAHSAPETCLRVVCFIDRTR
jgi:hypothetical protein